MKSVISLTLDVAKCTNCRACELACSFVKEGVYAPALARIQVIPIFSQGINLPIFCVHCEDAPCMQACPTDAIQQDDAGAAMHVDANLCTACGECVAACPIGAIQIPDEGDFAAMCDLCGGAPACVEHCIYGALRYESRPDTVFTAFECPLENEPHTEKRWRVAMAIADSVRATTEVG